MLYDISPPLHAGMPVWPGDTALQESPAWQLDAHCPVNVARLTLSPHSGAHADAPLHYQADGLAIGLVGLDAYLGPCRVVHCLDAAPLLSLARLQQALADQPAPLPPRLLIRSYRQFPQQWDPAFCAMDPALIDWLGQQGVRLIGVDSASLDAADSKTLAAHHAVARHGMAILENLYLDEIAAGDYELIALPLKLINLDASPVRAVLRTIPSPTTSTTTARRD
ncbi:arylformamidase [Aquitalea palustris]|uniref:Kynurenine formamidase n=1 Tax=Aquitalea palustris TaxID=2480983 RepID=A0A454JH10_9NEIS|nr:arylformamidase [Aquitalea palustris]RMC96160.1 arylformamidase [Aquitalea palustris]